MKNILFIAFAVLGSIICTYAQDRIYFEDGSVQEVKVVEITDKIVKYQAWNEAEGPLYTVRRETVSRVVYASGREETLTVPKPPEKERRTGNDYGRHFVAFNIADLFRTDVTFFYEYTFTNNRLGLRFPVTVGFNNQYFNLNSEFVDPYVFRRNRMFSIGADLRFTPGGQGKARYVMGPGLHYILNNKRGPIVGGTTVNNHPVSTIRLLLYNGVVFTPVPQFRFGFDMGLGTQYDLSDTQYADERVFGDPKIQFTWYAGYKF